MAAKGEDEILSASLAQMSWKRALKLQNLGKMGSLEVNVSCHLPNRVNSRRSVLGNAVALQH